MADPVNVQFNVTERGFDKILRDVGLLRDELEALGVDVSGPVQRALNGIEATSVRVSRSTREASNAYKNASRSARDLADATRAAATAEEALTDAQRRRQGIVSTERTVRTNQGQGGRDYQNASTSIDAIIAARQRENAVFTNQIEARLKGEAEEARKTAQAVDRLTQASERRLRVEQEYNRTRRRQDNRAALADFDAEFKQLEELSNLNNRTADPSVRYALFDVAAAYAAIGASLAGVAIYAGVVGAEFESAFVNVVRTASPEIDEFDSYIGELRDSLVQLSGQIPLTFSELSGIATLGNQLGIDEDAIASYTATVARFASVSGVSFEEVSRAFGGFIAQTGLGEEYLENLASAMALVSVRSNTTEAQIISLVREISATAVQAGFGADEIVGLAGALGSLQVAPERARGVLDTYFGRLTSAVAEGGDALNAFSAITGKTSEELTRLVRSGEGVEVFRSVIAGLAANTSDVVELDQALEAVGLTGLRAENTFNRFVGSLDVVDKSFVNANEGFLSGAEAIRQYEETAQTLESQFTILINGLNALVDAISGGAVGGLADLLRVVNNVIFAFADWLGDHRIEATIIAIAVAVAGVTGALLLVRAGLTVATAATYAARTAIANMGAAALASAGTLRGLASSLFAVEVGAKRGAIALNLLKRTLPGLLITGVLTGLTFLAVSFGEIDDKAGDAAISIEQLEQVNSALNNRTSSGAADAENFADKLGGGGTDSISGAAEEATIKVRTLVDYVNDLNGVFRRSSDIRFGSTEAIDEITLKWLELNEQVEKYQQQIRSLTADRALREYFLGIAEAYDDQLRAAQLREEIAKIDDQLAEAQAGASTELTGNTRAAIENRKVFRDLLGSYGDYVSALASAGASQEQIQAVISQLNGDFQRQAANLGFNSGELQIYGDRFRDLASIVAQVPRAITVNFNPDPAQQALNEFFAKLEEQAANSGSNAGEALSSGIGDGLGGGGGGGLGDIEFPELNLKTIQQQGRSAGNQWVNDFLEGVRTRPFNLIPIIGPYITEAIESGFGTVDVVAARGAAGGRAYGQAFVKAAADGVSGSSSSIDPWIDKQEESARFGGAGTGTSFATSTVDSAASTFGTVQSPLPKWIDAQSTIAASGAVSAGSIFGAGVNTAAGQTLNANSPLTGWLSVQNGSASSGGHVVGGTFGTNVSQSVGNTLNQSNSLATWIAAQNSIAYQNGSTIGSNIGGGIAAGLASAVSTTVTLLQTGGVLGIANLRGLFAEGGYTGAGHWLQPAGIVHRGEYVIPKKHVDQSTGLPDPSYVASLQRGKSAPKAAYNTGGYVSGGGLSGPVDLSAGTINAITRGLSVSLNVDQRRLAESTSRGNKTLSFTGSN